MYYYYFNFLIYLVEHQKVPMSGSHGSNISFFPFFKSFPMNTICSLTDQTSFSLFSNTGHLVLPVNEIDGHERHSVINYIGYKASGYKYKHYK